ncbi:inositol 1,4,5-trisphosphate receptor-interacting protein-like 1 [Lagopus muta]|uniref:inositol 1,4,5-trisphosphate receptor-interacting protein-like 1 n=1 Tax=Lagopus muta TaxID=64668 RepID=UPI00209ED7F3|nr:inositol 1,4,5-trisphosphate receptor-interacting protein-like 1 [Lagopus muta]
MALAFVFALLAHGIPFLGDCLDADTHEHAQQHEAYLQEQMTKLLLETEEKNAEESRMGVQGSYFSALQSWKVWALAVLLLFLLFRFLRNWYRGRQAAELSQQLFDLWNECDREMREPVCHGDPGDVTYVSRFYSEFSIWPLKSRRSKCKVVEELVDELLSVCHTVAQGYFMPRLQPAVGVGVGFEGRGPEGCYTVYRMLVPLKAPPGHVFQLEMGPRKRIGVRNSRIRVERQCMCQREQHMPHLKCFLHRPEDQLTEQMPSLLQTLCNESYLEMEKTATWFQVLVTEAWEAMPQSATMNLELLPSNRHCKLKLTTATGQVLWIELILGIQQDSETFLTFE